MLFDHPEGCSDAVPDLLRVLCYPCAKRVFQQPVRESKSWPWLRVSQEGFRFELLKGGGGRRGKDKREIIMSKASHALPSIREDWKSRILSRIWGLGDRRHHVDGGPR